MSFIRLIPKHFNYIFFRFWRAESSECIQTIVAGINYGPSDLFNWKTQIPTNILFMKVQMQNHNVSFTCWCEQCVRLYLLSKYSAVIDSALLHTDPSPHCETNDSLLAWKRFFFCSIASTTWMISIYFKNVILIEHPSPAPTPVSRRIFWACSNVGALSRALVMKWRAKYKRKQYFWTCWCQIFS